ncbi:Gfo/Idh/MocA family protein [Kiloniella sp.]|uniref:Gfo/Idh/MocA family protein n=1 Tax=Kiloniella sp. TaxID=1938587 RepID=UPI003B015ED9
MTLGIGFIGLGIMGNRMLTNMSAHGGFDLACGWDPDQKTGVQAKQQYPSLEIAQTVDELIANPKVEVVYIASPPASHKEYALAAAAAGKAVFCEKPLGVDIEQSRDLVAAFDESGLLNAVNFPLANSPAADMMKSEVDAGNLGTVTSVEIRLHFAPWPRGWQHSASWLAERAEGGFVREVGSHFIYLTERLFGPSELINACTLYPDDEVSCESNVQAHLSCGNVPVSFTASAGGVGPDIVEFIIWADKKSYRLSLWDQLFSTTGETWQQELVDIADARQEGYMRTLDNMLAWKEGKGCSMASFANALSVQESVEAILSGDA